MQVSGNPDASVSLLNVKDAQETAYLVLCFKPPAKRRFFGPFTCLKGDQDGLRGRSQHLLRMLSLTWERLCGPFVTSQSTDAQKWPFSTLLQNYGLASPSRLSLEIAGRRFGHNDTEPETQTRRRSRVRFPIDST